MSEAFGEYARYYDALYRDKRYDTEAKYIDSLIRKHSTIPVREILEFGAGTGRLQLELQKLGYKVRSLELSPEMIELASLSKARVELGDIRTYKADYKADAVVSFFHVFSYMTTRADAIASIKTSIDHLKPGGLLIFDFWLTEAVLSQVPEVRVKRVKDEVNDMIRIAEPSWGGLENTVQVDYQILSKLEGSELFSSISERHLLRYYSCQEIQDLGSHFGATLVRCEETLTSLEPSASTWSVTAVMRS